MSALDVVIAGARGGTNVGGSLEKAGQALGLRTELVDTMLAWRGPWLLTKLNWHLRGHRPNHLSAFSQAVLDACERGRPRWFISIGIAPVAAQAVRAIRDQGITTMNFLTDDLWNPAHRAPWAFASTREYDCVFSPRRSNMQDLRALGCPDVRYLPFGYDPQLFHHEDEIAGLESDVIFVGGADADRAPWLGALIAAGLDVAIYGSYWQRFPETRGKQRGLAEPDQVRRATAAAKIALCLVRRANRDGHVMRSLEIPAVGACMLVEDTEEHRALFGNDGETVRYFETQAEMVQRARWLLDRPEERQRLARAVHERITSGSHTYRHRLAEMLSFPLDGAHPQAVLVR